MTALAVTHCDMGVTGNDPHMDSSGWSKAGPLRNVTGLSQRSLGSSGASGQESIQGESEF